MRLGYARVSTEEQNLDLQLIALEANGCDRVITDHGISGARFDRPGLQEILALAQSGDTIVVWRLDRLGRSLSHLVGMMGDFRARGIHFASLNESIDTGTPAGMFMFHMIAALAEFERALIGERTRAGVAAARSRGQRLGRPPALDRHQIQQARDLLRTHPEAHVAAHFHIHHRTLRRLVRGPVAYPSCRATAAGDVGRDEADRDAVAPNDR
ncbi:recombinase family protein [Burkholderia territorii]|uniref:recombinase family protein n=1 Tax=Burkholderia territorii TaxID=1503055 RepID=UPI002ED7F2CB